MKFHSRTTSQAVAVALTAPFLFAESHSAPKKPS
jgi:hypothetical protein